MGKNSRSTVVVKERLGEGNDAAHDFSCQGRVHQPAGDNRRAPDVLQLPGEWTGGHDVVGETPAW